jgi:type VII secretion integral membrane protein EccD
LLTVVLLATVLAVKLAPSIARQAAKIRLPVFPSASGRWIFETRPDLPATVVVAAGADPELDGPESVRNVVVATDRVHSVLTGLLGGLSVLLVACSVGLSDPLTDRRWLPLLIAGIMAGWAVLHGRSYTDRWQATLLATAGAAIVVAAAARYALELWTAPSLLIACAVILAVPAAGLVAAIAVPQNFYTPVFKQLVEWVEYLLLLAMFPLGFWLMGVFAAIRYRS